MPDHDGLHHTAHLQWGYLTLRQAADHGFSRQLCNHYCRKGSWTRAARGIFRVHAVPERPDRDLALAHLLAADARGRPSGVISHASALYVHGLLPRRPASVHLSLPPGVAPRLPASILAFRRRVDLPWLVAGHPRGAAPPPPAPPYETDGYRLGLIASAPAPTGRWTVWAEPWRPRAAASGPNEPTNWPRPPLSAGDIEERAPFRVTSPLRAVLDCLVWGTPADLTSAVDRALGLELFTLDEALAALDGLPLFPGSRGLTTVLDAVRLRAERVAREITATGLRLEARRHHLDRVLPVPAGTGMATAEDVLAEALARAEVRAEVRAEAADAAGSPPSPDPDER